MRIMTLPRPGAIELPAQPTGERLLGSGMGSMYDLQELGDHSVTGAAAVEAALSLPVVPPSPREEEIPPFDLTHLADTDYENGLEELNVAARYANLLVILKNQDLYQLDITFDTSPMVTVHTAEEMARVQPLSEWVLSLGEVS